MTKRERREFTKELIENVLLLSMNCLIVPMDIQMCMIRQQLKEF